MRTFRRILPSLAALALTIAGTQALHAQATTGSITGTVVDPNGAPVEGAQVTVVSGQTGARTGAVVRDNGRYIVQGLETGPGYSVTVRRIGFAPQTKGNVTVTLGQATRVDFGLVVQSAVLQTVTVRGSANEDIISPTKTGVSTTISDTTLRRLPTLNRNFTDFVRLTPQVQQATSGAGGVSAGGGPSRLNKIQIDGANATDVFGLNSTGGQPGAQANGRAINLEAVKEYQVLLSPFDVRQGNFAGALINAVTKNGTNEFHGTVFGQHRNQDYGRNTPILRASNFDKTIVDAWVGGPIIKDRVFFSLAPSIQTQQSPASGPYLGQDASLPNKFLANADTIARLQTVLNKYGIDAGGAGAITNDNPLKGLFSRLDFNLPSIGSRFVIHNNYQDNRRDVFSRSTSQTSPTIALSSNSYEFDNKINQTVAQFYTNWASGANNELLLSYNITRDHRVPSVASPQITVDVGRQGTNKQYSLLVGADASSQANQLDQDITEVTDNYTRPIGAHTITVGTQNEFFKIRNLFVQNLNGTYVFNSIAALDSGLPSSYTGAVSQGANLAAQFGASSYSAYAQDLWSVSPSFNLTYGVRADIPVVNDKPFYNQQIDSIFHQRTDKVPSGYVQLSPRVGFNWDVTGDHVNQLRGGVGSFAGAPSFVFISNAFGNTGAGATQLVCNKTDSVPAFVADINAQPNVCKGGGSFKPYNQGGNLGAIATIDPNFKSPQSFRGSLGYDRQLTPTLTATVEALYTHAIEAPFYVNDNLGSQFQDDQGRITGLPVGKDRFGRVVYGTIDSTNGVARPRQITNRIPATGTSGLIRLTNENKDYSYSYTGKLNKRFGNGAQLEGSYTYGHSYDVQSLTSDVASSNFRFGRTLGTRANTEKYLGRSLFDAPHRILIDGSYTVKPTRTDFTVIYDGHSGAPYDYVYASGATNSGDLNADGYQGNDLVYVPTDVTDPNQIRWRTRLPVTGATKASTADSLQDVRAQQSAFERLIETTPCLRDARGKIMERNSCRNPWQNDMQVSVRQSLPSIWGNNLSLQMDVFNFLNLLNKNWGQQSTAGGNTQVNILTHQGESSSTLLGPNGAVPIVTYGSAAVPNPAKYTSSNVSSNWQFQIGLRYGF